MFEEAQKPKSQCPQLLGLTLILLDQVNTVFKFHSIEFSVPEVSIKL